MSENRVLTGRCWVFPDNISTDDMLPGHAFAIMQNPDVAPSDLAKHCMEACRPGWYKQVLPGDIIIGGKNFGCGSSRPAALVLKALGIAAVAAESVARVFFRNTINLALPVLGGFEGADDIFRDGDMAQMDLTHGKLKNLTTGKMCQGTPLEAGSPPDEILRSGGLIPYLLARYEERFEKEKQDEHQ